MWNAEEDMPGEHPRDKQMLLRDTVCAASRVVLAVPSNFSPFSKRGGETQRRRFHFSFALLSVFNEHQGRKHNQYGSVAFIMHKYKKQQKIHAKDAFQRITLNKSLT